MTNKPPFSRTAMNKAEQSAASRIWQAIRKVKVFTIDAIAEQAQLATQEVQGYIFWLRRCGYVDFTTNGFELIKDTGDSAPVGLKTGFYDPNVRQL